MMVVLYVPLRKSSMISSTERNAGCRRLSAKISFGLAITARAIATNCCCQPKDGSDTILLPDDVETISESATSGARSES